MTERLFLGLLTPSEILAVLTFVLVIVTAYYASQTRSTVKEMRQTRLTAILPRLAVSIHAPGAGNGWPKISNVGPGPAIDVDARLSFIPNGPDVTWRAHIVAPNEVRQIFPPKQDDPHQIITSLSELTTLYTHVRLTAAYKDAAGELHTTDEAIEVREWWTALRAAHERLQHDPAEETVKELEKLRKAVEKLASDVHKIEGKDDAWTWDIRVRMLPKPLQGHARQVLKAMRVLN
jgi:hypothetical protein